MPMIHAMPKKEEKESEEEKEEASKSQMGDGHGLRPYFDAATPPAGRGLRKKYSNTKKN